MDIFGIQENKCLKIFQWLLSMNDVYERYEENVSFSIKENLFIWGYLGS